MIDLGNLILVLLAAWLAGSVATRLGYPSILGELLGGILLGPGLVALLYRSEGVEVLAELGVLLMMLYVGMEIDPRELGKASWPGLLAAVGGFVTPAVLGYLVVVWMGGSATEGLFVAIAVGVTSLATKSRILVDLRLLDTRIAHVLVAGALVSDTTTLVIFAAIIGVAGAGVVTLGGMGLVAGKAILFFGITGLVGVVVFPWIGRALARAEASRTLNFIVVVLLALVFGELAELAGLHAILGAFLAGLFLREGILERRISRQINDLVYDISVGFLAPVFFVTAGFDVTLDVFRTDLTLFALIMVVAFVGKILGTALFYLPSGHGWREGLTVGAGMNGRGAVEIIVAEIGLEAGLISQEIFSILVFMAIFTTATVPALLKWTTDWLRRRGELVRTEEQRKGTVIVGAGPYARRLGKALAESQPVCLVDRNRHNCALARREGLRVVEGSALDEEALAEAGAAEARSLVAATPNTETNVLAAQLAHNLFVVPKISVLLMPEEGQSLRSVVEEIEAEPLFPEAVDIRDWDQRLLYGETQEMVVSVEEPADRQTIFERLHDSLPLTVRRDGTEVVFGELDSFEPGDEVVVLSRGRSPLMTAR